MVVRAGWHRSANRSVWSGPFRPTACKAFCWRTYFLICRWRAAYYSRHWKTFPANNVSLPPSLGCAAGIFSASSTSLVATATNPAGCRAYLYALFRQLRHRAIAGRRSAGNYYRAGYLSAALSYDYDPARAAMLALLQMVLLPSAGAVESATK